MLNTTPILKKLGFFYLILFIFIPLISTAQTTKIEKLMPQLKQNLPDTARLRILRELATAYSSVDQEKKFLFAKKSMELAKKLKADTLVVEAYIDMGGSHAIQSHMDSALFYFNKGHDEAKRIKYKSGIARSLASIGFVFDKTDNEKGAIEKYEEALVIYKSIGHKKGINQCLINIGGIYYDHTEYEMAELYFSQAYESNKAIGNEVGTASALFSLGGANKRLGNTDKAYGFYTESLKIRERLGDLNGIALSRWGLGTIDIERGQYKKALSNLNIALKHDIALKNTYHESAVLLSIATAHLGLKDYKKAYSFADLAYSNSKKIDSKNVRLEALKVYIKIAKEQEDFDNAFKYQSHYLALLDTVDTEKVSKHVKVTDFKRVNSENEVLAKDNQAIGDKNSEYLKTIAVTSALLLLVMVLLVLLFYRYKEKKAINQILHQKQEEIAKINTELEQLNGVKNKFFSIVSHDLRHPLSNLKMLFSLYRDGHLKEAEMGQLLSKMEDAISSTANFLDNLLEWSKSQLDGITVRPVAFKLSELVAENIQIIDHQAKTKGISIEHTVPENLTVFADQNMIHVVLRNLLANCVKFCNPGDLISITAWQEKEAVLFKVKDNGPGMSADTLKNIFSLEHSVSTGTSGEKGHQIGLILCKDMVEQNNGSISVESESGNGSQFTITLPRRPNS